MIKVDCRPIDTSFDKIEPKWVQIRHENNKVASYVTDGCNLFEIHSDKDILTNSPITAIYVIAVGASIIYLAPMLIAWDLANSFFSSKETPKDGSFSYTLKKADGYGEKLDARVQEVVDAIRYGFAMLSILFINFKAKRLEEDKGTYKAYLALAKLDKSWKKGCVYPMFRSKGELNEKGSKVVRKADSYKEFYEHTKRTLAE